MPDRFYRIVLCAVMAFGCRLNAVHALPPEDETGLSPDASGDQGADGGSLLDGGPTDAGIHCVAGVNTDGDERDDCSEIVDSNPYVDWRIFNGLVATIGDVPSWTGSCSANLSDYATMASHFASSSRSMKVWAGWDFETPSHKYDDPSFGFKPNWPSGSFGSFSLRLHGKIAVPQAGTHCFSIDIGATGTDIIGGTDNCGQVYVNGTADAGAGSAWVAETGFGAPSTNASVGCINLAAGEATLDIVLWDFNILAPARLHVRSCFGGNAPCAPNAILNSDNLHAEP